MQPQAPMVSDGTILLIILGVAGVCFVIWLAIGLAVLLTLHRTLGLCQPGNRTMEPAMVWLNLIPCYGLVWQFITVLKVSETLRNEFDSRGEGQRGETYGQGIGIASCVLYVTAILFGVPALIASQVCLIIYWLRIAEFRRRLQGVHDGDSDDDGREYYEEPRRRRRDDDEYDVR
jgi:cobalamin synthase